MIINKISLPLFVGLLITLLFFGFKNNEQSAWNIEMYNQYTFKNYENYKPFSERMNPNILDIPLLNAAVFYETNRERVTRHLVPLKYSKKAERACFLHSEDMVKEDFFSHTNPNKERETTSKRLTKEGINWGSCAENIAIGLTYPFENKSYYPPTTEKNYFRLQNNGQPVSIRTYTQMAKEILRMWMNSKGHKTNILNSAYTHLGCGNYIKLPKSEQELPKIYSTQNFFTYLEEIEIQNN